MEQVTKVSQIPKELANYTAEQLEAIARVKTAQTEMRELEVKGLQDFKIAVGNAKNLDESYRLAKSFAWHVEKNRRVLNPSTGKKGRQKKVAE